MRSTVIMGAVVLVHEDTFLREHSPGGDSEVWVDTPTEQGSYPFIYICLKTID